MFFGAIWGYVTETHILVPDRNILSKKSMRRYLYEQTRMLVKGICCLVPSGGVIAKMPRFCAEF